MRVDRMVGAMGDSLSMSNAPVDPRGLHERYAAQFEKVKRILMETNMFTRTLVDAEAQEFYNNLGLNEYYFQTASPQMIATNLQCVIAAKLLNEASNNDIFPLIQQESPEEVFWMTRSSLLNRKASQNYAVEKQLEKKYLGMGADQLPWRLQCYRSTGSIFDDPERYSERLRTYFLQKPEWPSGKVDPNETDWSKVADVYFFKNKAGTQTERIFRELNQKVVSDPTGLGLHIHVEPRSKGTYRIDLAFRRAPPHRELFSTLGDTISMWGLYSQRKYVEPLANGVTIVTQFVDVLPDKSEVLQPELTMEKRIANMLKAVRMQFILPRSPFTDLALTRHLTVHEAAFAYAAARFVYHFSSTVGPAFAHIASVLEGSHQVSANELYQIRARLKAPQVSEESVIRACEAHVEIVKKLYQEFQEMHHPTVFKARGKLTEWEEKSALAAEIERLENPVDQQVFNYLRLFIKHVLRTNFWKENKLGLSFRMDAAFLPESDYPRRPYSIFFFAGSQYTGFHTRFQDIARGGIRVVQSLSQQAFNTNRQRAFDECYNLARTQQYKNKDIPEGGAKGVVLLDAAKSREEANALTPVAFKKYIDSFCDLLFPDDTIVDRLGKEEVCFFGPDENTGTGGLMDWACEHSKVRGNKFWKAFTTGKMPIRGGIPHDMFGMTTTSVEAYVKGLLAKKGLVESEVTRVLVGGPDGDLGSNALLMSECKTIAMADGFGVLYDPEGLDKAELRRLVTELKLKGKPTSSQEFDASKLSAKGFKMSIADRDFKLPDGTVVANGRQFRDEFHLNPMLQADLFNPCAGRPEAITSLNVHQLFNENGEPRYKFIVEGANVFITNDARRYLEKHGVVLFKDASTNKGGVTSSSLEVLCALALTDEEFDKNMRVADIKNPTEFYRNYVKDVQKKIAENARLEFEALWREGERTGIPRCDLTDTLSGKIISLDAEIQQSSALWNDEKLREVALSAAIPDVLLPGVLDVPTLMQRVPLAYLKSIFSSFLSARFYYTYGIDANPFAFFDFINKLKSEGWSDSFLATHGAQTPSQRRGSLSQLGKSAAAQGVAPK